MQTHVRQKKLAHKHRTKGLFKQSRTHIPMDLGVMRQIHKSVVCKKNPCDFVVGIFY